MRMNARAPSRLDVKLEESHKRAVGAVELPVSDDDWRRALEFASRFRLGSFGGTVLICTQHVDAIVQGIVSSPEPSPKSAVGTERASSPEVDLPKFFREPEQAVRGL